MIFQCKDCLVEFTSRRGLLNHLHTFNCTTWKQQEQELYKKELLSILSNVEFIEYIYTDLIKYKCLTSNEIVIKKLSRLRRDHLCGCSLHRYQRKSETSIKHWQKDRDKHAKAISKSLLSNQAFREKSSRIFLKTRLENSNLMGKSWSASESSIDSYLSELNIEHNMNSVLLHLDGTTKNFIYDVYLPDYNCLIELNDKHLLKELLLDDAKINKLTSKTKRDEAIRYKEKYYLALSKGYDCYFFFSLDECKEFIASLKYHSN